MKLKVLETFINAPHALIMHALKRNEFHRKRPRSLKTSAPPQSLAWDVKLNMTCNSFFSCIKMRSNFMTISKPLLQALTADNYRQPKPWELVGRNERGLCQQTWADSPVFQETLTLSTSLSSPEWKSPSTLLSVTSFTFTLGLSSLLLK